MAVERIILNHVKGALRKGAHHFSRVPLAKVYHRYKDLTMIRQETYIDNLELARLAASVEGCIVECGVWRGGMMGGMASVLGSGRSYFLVDSFEGLPPAKDADGQKAKDWQSDTTSSSYYNNCSAEEEFAREAMKRASVSNYRLVRGWFENTVPSLELPSPIALLRLDGDWYDSTMVCLDHLFDKVADGGIVIIDDYFAWDGCSRAVHDFLSKRSALERLRTNGNVCYTIRARAAD